MKQYTVLFLFLSAIAQAHQGCCGSTTKQITESVVAAPAVEYTFAMIKPDAVKKGSSGDIIAQIERNGFEIIEMHKKTFTKQEAEAFYAEHKGKPFFNDLVSYITSGPVIGLKLKKHNAIADWRTLIGSTDPSQASVGTIRKMFAESKSNNAVHGSDSTAAAERELQLFF